ncbi:MAG: tetratricopeptide repeat protein [Alphaproteobacteria bacterium]|jgi:protein O-GlcNAc transferase|nr:tetratricopeptide repeat protein [Alphaproteobacteria bacterium]MBT4019175.1 tetratricopeptide repeat protein [Alphaproteobacteria bacterium]MBT5160284.1 tetratricopeptide repeat protein [Alphaproteobacteria bacterium]MBT6385563.1 tetratricopeptide repeat protein [Alphaproteobacteria bacterium]
MIEPQNAFQEALVHHKAARLDEAASLYLEAIEHDPGHTDAMCNFAALRSTQGAFDEAGQYFELALCLMPNDADILTNYANMLARQGMRDKAESRYRKAMEVAPSSITSCLGLGQLLLAEKRIHEAVSTFRQAVDLKPDSSEAWRLLATAQSEAGQLEEAISSLGKCLEINPNDSPAAFSFGTILRSRGNLEQAIILFQRALQNCTHATACIIAANLAEVLADTGQKNEAIKVLLEVLKHFPDFTEGWNNLGTLYLGLDRFDDAIAAYKKGRSLSPENIVVANNLAAAFLKSGHPDKAQALYRQNTETWPDQPDTWTGLGNVLVSLEKFDEAIAAYSRTMELFPDHVDALHGRAVANHRRASTFGGVQYYRDALDDYHQVATLDPSHLHAHQNMGLLFQLLDEHEKAIGAFRRVLQDDPRYLAAYSSMAYSLQHCCQWENLAATIDRVVELTREEINSGDDITASPFNLLQMSAPGDVRLASARQVSNMYKRIAGTGDSLNFDYKKPADGKLRIGYMSPDFRGHSVGRAFEELLAAHDRDKFTLYGYYTGTSDDEVTTRLRRDFDVFRELVNVPFRDAAKIINDDGINILVDLAGHTKGCRFEVLALKPAPIQAHFLGYGFTTGADYIDWLITDAIKTPEEERPWVSEGLAYLPNQCLPASRPIISTENFSREQFGLPEEAFVFADFNSHFKIDPEVFSAWMRILRKAPNSVLWLIDFKGPGNDALLAAANTRGVDTDRIIFADKYPNDVHLARLALADLALDTYHHAGGVTTTDALWAGLPVLTIMHDGMVDRLGGSVLTAAELPELIASSLDDYMRKALAFYEDRDALRTVRQKLKDNQATAPLFDTPRLTRDLEAIFSEMWQRYEDGATPADIQLPPVPADD